MIRKDTLLTFFDSCGAMIAMDVCSDVISDKVSGAHEDVIQYFSKFLPAVGFRSRAGALLFLCEDQIENEIAEGAWPGCITSKKGMLPIARTIGGNLLCASLKHGTVRMADHSYITEDFLYYNDDQGKLTSTPMSEESLNQMTPFVAASINDLIEGLLIGENGAMGQKIFEMG